MSTRFTRAVAICAGLLLWASPALSEEIPADLVEPCTACHGEKGLPEDPAVPILWGQESYYLYVQLKDFKAGRRANEIMSGIAADLDKETMKSLGRYFAGQQWPGTGYRATEDQIAKAQAGLAAGQCVQCHLGGYEGSSRNPLLSGQKA